MWSSIGSLRESAQRRLNSVRDNAIAAAQVAQDVLTAAATDEPLSPQSSEQAEYEQWPTPADDTSPPSKLTHEISTPPPPPPQDALYPPHSPPPPPPSDSDSPGRQSSLRSSRPSSRYVVTGKESAPSTVPAFLAPPRPSFNVKPMSLETDGQIPPPPANESSHRPASLHGASPPSSPPPPPPPPSDAESPGPQRLSGRSSRYVVTGKETAAPAGVTFLAPPRPLFNVKPNSEVKTEPFKVADPSQPPVEEPPVSVPPARSLTDVDIAVPSAETQLLERSPQYVVTGKDVPSSTTATLLTSPRSSFNVPETNKSEPQSFDVPTAEPVTLLTGAQKISEQQPADDDVWPEFSFDETHHTESQAQLENNNLSHLAQGNNDVEFPNFDQHDTPSLDNSKELDTLANEASSKEFAKGNPSTFAKTSGNSANEFDWSSERRNEANSSVINDAFPGVNFDADDWQETEWNSVEFEQKPGVNMSNIQKPKDEPKADANIQNQETAQSTTPQIESAFVERVKSSDEAFGFDTWPSKNTVESQKTGDGDGWSFDEGEDDSTHNFAPSNSANESFGFPSSNETAPPVTSVLDAPPASEGSDVIATVEPVDSKAALPTTSDLDAQELIELREEVTRLQGITSTNASIAERLNVQLEALQLEVQSVRKEKDELELVIRRTANEKNAAEHKLEELQDEVANVKDDVYRARAERDDARETIQRLEARLQHANEEREANLRQQLETEAMESNLVEKERQISVLSQKLDATQRERDDAFEARSALLSEQQNITNEIQTLRVALHEKDDNINALQGKFESIEIERADRKAQLHATTSQLSELEYALEKAISERNDLHAERRSLLDELEKSRSDASAIGVGLAEQKRKLALLKGDMQDRETKSKGLQTELEELRERLHNVVVERDALVVQRSSFSKGAVDIPATIKNLTTECEAKSIQINALQRQLKSATTKVTKLTAQRNTILRQRDDAGARLSAAGGEFATLSAKLKKYATSNAEALKSIEALQNERDEAFQKIAALSAAASKSQEYEQICVETQQRLEKSQYELGEARESLRNSEDNRRAVESELRSCIAERDKLNDLYGVSKRELEGSSAEVLALRGKEEELLSSLNKERQAALEAGTALRRLEADMYSNVERLENEKNALRSEFSAEKESMASVLGEIEQLRVSLAQKDEVVSSLRKELESSLQRDELTISEVSDGDPIDLTGVRERSTLMSDASLSDYEFLQSYGKVHREVFILLKAAVSKFNDMAKNSETLQSEKEQHSAKIRSLEREASTMELSLAYSNNECERLRNSEASLQQAVEESKALMSGLEVDRKKLMSELESSRIEIRKLQDELDSLGITIAEERSTRDSSAAEKVRLRDQIALASAHIDSMWSLLQQTLRADVVESIMADGERNGEDGSMSSVSVMVIQGFRALSAEIDQFRNNTTEYEEKLTAAQREIDSIWERTEIAEGERDKAKAACDQWERQAKAAKDEAFREAHEETELQIAHLIEELENAREDVSILQDSLEKTETENSELRNSCSKLTSKTNNASRQLEESEENVVYLQDEITNLKEDLERVTGELDASRDHTTKIEEQVMLMRDEREKSKNALREIQLVMETHKTAEQNLQIAIEQLEAEKESTIQSKTLELQKRLDESLESLNLMKKQVEEATVAMNQLALRDEEITELRTALQRLTDERVELKLELEKSLSRLNHPDGDGQLVDRRVIRQLLVNYFRVGIARRRDVLELMSRILGFSETDMVTVGLKRVNLSERIGSMLQPPDLDGNQLPPIGNVSDKWIEFLMKETEEDDDF